MSNTQKQKGAALEPVGESGTHMLPSEASSNNFPKESCDVMNFKWKGAS